MFLINIKFAQKLLFAKNELAIEFAFPILYFYEVCYKIQLIRKKYVPIKWVIILIKF